MADYSQNHQPSLAIVGSGIAGLGCFYLLKDVFRVTVLEQNRYLGGHTNTITVEEGRREVHMDTGFMVFNKVTYPNLVALFDLLGVRIKRTSMSFSVQHIPSGLEYSGSSLNHLFAQRKNILRWRHWKMLGQINRFNKEAVETLQNEAVEAHTLGEYCNARGYGDDFLFLYLLPMSSAVWSAPPEKMMDFPARTLLRFFHNHGFLGLHTQHPWWTVVDGARSYVEIIKKKEPSAFKLNAQVKMVSRGKDCVRVQTADGETQVFDKVIMACHADQALNILDKPTPLESETLKAFRYQNNRAVVHTDESVMPVSKKCWSSWNYRLDGSAIHNCKTSTVYWMNELQGVSDQKNYFVSINGSDLINEKTVLRVMDYEHPIFDVEANRAQSILPSLNKQSNDQGIYFCGSYFKYGFHEDALKSAVDVSRLLRPQLKWPIPPCNQLTPMV